MFGPDILARTLSVPTTGTGKKPFAYGNAWQYHSRSDRHSKVACWGLTLDLLTTCPLLRQHIVDEKVGLGINHELGDFRNNKKKNLDLVLCRAVSGKIKGGSKGGVRGAHDFAGLVQAYGIILSGPEQRALAALPPLLISGVSTVLLAAEAKAAMTAYSKARPRLKDELTSSFQTIHGDNEHAIAAGIIMVNAADTFISPDLNKHDLKKQLAVVSQHRQPQDAQKIVDGLRDIQRRAKVSDAGFDAVAVVAVDCRNDGSPVKIISKHPPAPVSSDDFYYARFVNRIAHLYGARFSAL